MAFGIDYAGAPPSPAVLAKQGVKFVCRYVSTLGNPKNLTLGEKTALLAEGIAIVVVFETTADRARKGKPAGIQDAQSAASQLFALGLLGAPVYFAVDFDATPADQEQINAYLAGAVSQLGHDRVGVYGGYHVVKRALDANACKYAWQTYAWSGGQWDPRAQLRQVKNGQHLSGVGTPVDFDYSTAADYGQTPRPVKPVPVAVRRRRLRAWITAQRAEGATWAALKRTRRWRLWRKLGGK